MKKEGPDMKKLLAFVLALMLAFSALLPAFAEGAQTDEKQAVIIVPGVIESMLFFGDGPNGSRRFFDPAGDFIRNSDNVKALVLAALKALFFFRYDSLNEQLRLLNDAAVGGLAMNPDGTSVNDMRVSATEPADCSYAALQESGNWKHVDYGAMIAVDLAEQIGAENVFVFNYDWRLGSTEHAERLRSFISGVKELTGAEKVSLYGNSYGCQVVAKYLYDYASEGNVARAVFNAPAWQGTPIFKALMVQSQDELVFNIIDGSRTLLRFLMLDYDFEPLMKLIPERLSKRAMFTLIDNTIDKYLLYSPGLWCCCAKDDYEEMKALLLDEERDAAFIAKVDEAQYGIMSHIPEMLGRAQDAGVAVAVTMNDGTRLFAGKNINGDGVVDTVSASGGEAVPFGETFADGRTGPHVSPSDDLDLTNAYLPDRTWVVSGQTHGQTHWDDATQALIPKLLLTDELETVFSDPSFPQFIDSHCPAFDVSIRLTDGADKTLSPAKGKITAQIRNDSGHDVLLNGVTVCGLPYIASPVLGKLAPGETKEFTLTPLSKDASPKYGRIAVSYFDTGVLPYAKTRAQAFRIG